MPLRACMCAVWMEVTVWVDGGRTATEVGGEEAGEDQEIGRFARLGKLGRLGRGRGKGFGEVD